MNMWKHLQPVPFRTFFNSRYTCRQMRSQRIRLKSQFILNELRDLLIFSPVDRAGAVDQRPALFQILNDICEDFFLKFMELFQLFTGDLYEMVENVLLFFPLGMLMCGLDFNTRPLHFMKERKSYHFIRFVISMAFAVIFTFVIELLQFNLRVGVFTLDDILCNTTGAVLGYGIVFGSIMISRKIRKQKARGTKEEINEQRTDA